MGIGKLFEKMFGLSKFEFSKIKIKKDVVESMIGFAKTNYPKEFIALLQGQVKDGSLIIDSLVYQPFNKSRTSASIVMNPNIYKIFGSVHSHPYKSGPSRTDLAHFNRQGAIHFIISYPYREEDLVCYDRTGNQLEFEVIK
jgi:proteasome lid subunit RPN8/RPN11